MENRDYEALVGKVLMQHITDANGVLLISKGTTLLPEHIKQLKKFKINILDLETTSNENEPEQQSTEPDNMPTQEPRVQFTPLPTRELIQRTEFYLKEIEGSLEQGGAVSTAVLEEKFFPVVMEATRSTGLFRLVSELKGDFRYQQSMGVAFIATKLGRKLKLDTDEQILLTTAAALYDIGTTKLPSDLIHKPSNLNNNELAIMKQHTIWGFNMLTEAKVDPRIALVALQHHEREDGSGYPHGSRGSEIDPLSKIVALSDMYMAMISPRPYRPAHSFFSVVNTIHEEIIEKRFDAFSGLMFLESLMTSQLGCEVILSDQRRGRIVLIDKNHPTEPLVELENKQFIDLREHKNVKLKEIIG